MRKDNQRKSEIVKIMSFEKVLDELANAVLEIQSTIDCSSYHPHEIVTLALELTAAS